MSSPVDPMDQVRLDLRRTSFDAKKQGIAAGWLKRLMEYGISYYQGLHDVALNCRSYDQLEHLAFCVLRDFMTRDLDCTLKVLALIPELVVAADPEMSFIEAVPPHYAIAPIITLFSHNDHQVEDVFEHAQTQGLEFIVYLYAALLLTKKTTIQKNLEGLEGNEFVHAILNQITLQSVDDRKKLYLRTTKLRSQVPLKSLRAYNQVSSFSAVRGVLGIEKARTHYVRLMEPPRHVATYTITILALAIALQFWMSAE